MKDQEHLHNLRVRLKIPRFSCTSCAILTSNSLFDVQQKQLPLKSAPARRPTTFSIKHPREGDKMMTLSASAKNATVCISFSEWGVNMRAAGCRRKSVNAFYCNLINTMGGCSVFAWKLQSRKSVKVPVRWVRSQIIQLISSDFCSPAPPTACSLQICF